MNKNDLSKLLHKHDPMGTSCTVNKGMESEYDAEASEILLLLSSGVPFKQAYFSTMSAWFWEDIAIASTDVFNLIQLEYYSHTV
jgi:hypothetical protein